MQVEVHKQYYQTDAVRPEKPKQPVAEVTTSTQGKGCMNQNGHKLDLYEKRKKIRYVSFVTFKLYKVLKMHSKLIHSRPQCPLTL